MGRRKITQTQQTQAPQPAVRVTEKEEKPTPPQFSTLTKDQIIEEYKRSYDIDNLTTPNDRANLDTMIMNALAIRSLQEKLLELAVENVIDNASDIKRINDSIRDLTQTNLAIERQLSIDRKTRRSESEQSVLEYINWLKDAASEFLSDTPRLTKISCKRCNIMVGRISGVYDTTFFSAEFQCPQCKKHIYIRRDERDTFYDIRDPDWRRKYPIEIIQPNNAILDAPLDTGLVEDDVVISNTVQDVTEYEDKVVEVFSEPRTQE
jgi:ssDNA-binding Zn-finger/Zn-ribbon topoisomerase 1